MKNVNSVESSSVISTENAGDKYLVHVMTNTKHTALRTHLESLKKTYGRSYPEDNVKVSFGVIGPMLYYHSVEGMKAVINEGFALAVEYNFPVYFQIDDMGYLEDTYIDPGANGEWVSNEYANLKNLHETKRFTDEEAVNFFNWGSWCYNSNIPAIGDPELIAWVTAKAKEGIVEPILENLKKLRGEGKEWLFAGVAVGWESSVSDSRDDTRLFGGMSLDPDEVITAGPVNPASGKPKLTMSLDDCEIKVFRSVMAMGKDTTNPYYDEYIKYGAVTNEKSLEQAAKKYCEEIGYERDPEKNLLHTKADVYMLMMADRALDRYITELSKVFRTTTLDGFLDDNGKPYQIAREKIFTHVCSYDSVQDLDNMPENGILPTSSAWPSVRSSVNEYSTPGYTLSNASGARYNLPVLKQLIKKAAEEKRIDAPTQLCNAEGYARGFNEDAALTVDYLDSFYNVTDGMNAAVITVFGYPENTGAFACPKEHDSEWVKGVYHRRFNTR